MKEIGDKQQRKNKLQTMSEFATMRFELRNNNLYQTKNTVKKTTYSRFGKSKQKQQRSASSAKLKQNRENLLKIQEAVPQEELEQEQPNQEFHLKYLQKLSNEHILVGNEYQLDMLKLSSISNSFIDVNCKWSICPSDLITSLSIDTKYSMIAASLGKNVDILKYNLKRQHQCPEIIVKHTHQEEVQYVRFVRNMSMFVILQSKIEFYRINIVCEKAELSLCFVHKINYGPNMKLYHVPQTIDNSLILYFYENKVKPEERNKFGLWMQSIQAKATSDTPSVGKLMLNYNIEVRDRKEFSIYNYNKDICLIKFKFTIMAAKNGFVIDETNTNFHSENSFIDYVQTSNKVVHFRKTFIDLYQLSMNFNSKPQTIQLQCLDSISFLPPTNGKLFKVIELEPQCYAIFYESASKNLKTNPQIEYTFCVSQEANLKSKIDILYPSKQEIETVTIQALQDTCSQAKKLGMSNKEAYYELWRRSNKTSKMDYHILISTEDFGTIEREIEKKLKSQAMSIREVINIYAEALEMLKLQVMGPKCTVNTLIQYSSCQFSLRKFQMLRYLRNQQKIATQKDTQENNQVIMITIKDYYEYSDMEILQQLVDLVGKYLLKQQESTIRKIEAIIKYFKLIFRLNYIQTLDKIVSVCKMRVFEILLVIPELLPYLYEEQDQGLGTWKEVSQEEKDENVFLSSLMTIDNRTQIQDFPKHIWFRRYNKIRHGVILVKRQDTNNYLTTEYCKIEDIFYKFLVQIYHFKTYDDKFWQLIEHIEEKYPFLPTHLKGKFKLYVLLYQIFISFKEQYEMEDFLKAKELQLFKRYFIRQKIEKGGFVLKKIRPVYQKILKDGTNIFNQGLYNYFASPESTVADLKCILNKLNNEKNEFHIAAEKMYQVLINAIMKKIKIGTECDTPIDEILVYIENIPFPIHNDSIMTNLQYIQEINYESEILKKIRVNMTLQQIVDSPKQVIEMMVEYEVNRHEVFNLRDYRSLRLHSYKILSEVQCRKSNIYGEEEHSFGFKIYLINIMTSKQMIELCSKLLKDQYLKSEYHIYTDVIEEVVMVLYHWKLKTEAKNQKNYYLLHAEYIQALASLLEPSNPKRRYIQYSIRYAELLTFENGFKITYPLFSAQIKYPTLSDFIQTINCLTASEMVQIRLKDLFEVMISLKKLKEDEILNSQQLKIYQKKLEIELYQHLIVRLIEQKQLKSALENIFYLLSLPQQYPQYNIVFPCLIIEKLIPELLTNSIQLIVKLISYYYTSPLDLTSIIKELFSRPFSNQEIDSYLELKIKQHEIMPIFCLSNAIISDKIKQNWENNPKKVNMLFQLCLQRIIRYNQGYLKSWHLHIMYRLMCHNPLVISKWLYCKKAGINVKTIRSFLSYMSLQIPFNHEETVLAGKQIFQIIRFHYTHHIFFSEILKWREKISFQHMQQLSSMNQIDSDDKPLDLINQCIQAFEQKLIDLQAEQNRLITEEKEKIDMSYMVAHPEDYFQQPLSQYIYKDKDDWYQKGSEELFLPIKKRSRSNLRQETDPKYSQTAERPNCRFEQLIVPRQANRPRKYTEYFPEMLDVQQLSSDIQSSRRHQTPKHHPSFNFETALQNQIMEDNNENISSNLHIDIGSQEIAKDGNVHESLRSIEIHMQKGERTLKPENEPSKRGHRSILSDSGSQASSRQVPSENDEILLGGFQINILDDKEEIKLPVQDLAERLLSTEPDQLGRFDLGALESQAKKPNFQNYLKLLLSEIYSYSLVEFQKRIKVVQAIASLYEPSFTKREGIVIFNRVQTLKIPHLSFDILQIIPIELVFQSSQEKSFEILLEHLLPKVNSLNIYHALQLVNHLFRDDRFKDQLLMRFILYRLRQAKSEAETEKNTLIILSLFDHFSALNQCLQNSIMVLKAGDDLKIAQILRKLALQYKIQSQ